MEFSTKGVAAVQSGITAVAASIGGFTAAGLAGTVQGERLAFTMGELSREIAATVLPITELFTSILRDMVNWFRGLSESGQNLVGVLAITAIGAAIVGKAFLAMGIEIGIATAGISLIIGAIVAFIAYTPALREGFGKIMTQFSRFANILGPPLIRIFELLGEVLALVVVPTLEMVAAILEKIADFVENSAIMKALGIVLGGGKGGGERRSMQQSGGGMESIAQTYTRLQQAAIKTDYPKKQTEILEKIENNTRRTDSAPGAVGAATMGAV